MITVVFFYGASTFISSMQFCILNNCFNEVFIWCMAKQFTEWADLAELFIFQSVCGVNFRNCKKKSLNRLFFSYNFHSWEGKLGQNWHTVRCFWVQPYFEKWWKVIWIFEFQPSRSINLKKMKYEWLAFPITCFFHLVSGFSYFIGWKSVFSHSCYFRLRIRSSGEQQHLPRFSFL